jgi:hypothetical protein
MEQQQPRTRGLRKQAQSNVDSCALLEEESIGDRLIKEFWFVYIRRFLMPRIKRAIWITASLVLVLFGTSALGLFALESAAAQSSGDVIYLDQGWSQADRAMYYQISQGSQTIGYDIYLNLEVAGSQELFRSDANSERFGLIPQAANPQTNPDALAIGVT